METIKIKCRLDRQVALAAGQTQYGDFEVAATPELLGMLGAKAKTALRTDGTFNVGNSCEPVPVLTPTPSTSDLARAVNKLIDDAATAQRARDAEWLADQRATFTRYHANLAAGDYELFCGNEYPDGLRKIVSKVPFVTNSDMLATERAALASAVAEHDGLAAHIAEENAKLERERAAKKAREDAIKAEADAEGQCFGQSPTVSMRERFLAILARHDAPGEALVDRFKAGVLPQTDARQALKAELFKLLDGVAGVQFEAHPRPEEFLETPFKSELADTKSAWAFRLEAAIDAPETELGKNVDLSCEVRDYVEENVYGDGEFSHTECVVVALNLCGYVGKLWLTEQ